MKVEDIIDELLDKYIMDLSAEKLQLIQQILQINDAVLISSVKNLLAFGLEPQEEKAAAVTDFWQGLSTKQKSQIELSIQQLDNNEGLEHKKVMADFRMLIHEKIN